MKLGRYVLIVDDGDNYVTFYKLNVRIEIKKVLITPQKVTRAQVACG